MSEKGVYGSPDQSEAKKPLTKLSRSTGKVKMMNSELSEHYSIHRIVHPTDFSPVSRRALVLSVDLAKLFNAALVLVHVVPLPTFFDNASQLHHQAEAAMSELVNWVREQNVTVKSNILQGKQSTNRQIVQAAKRIKADLIVMGTHGHGIVSRFLIGGVASAVISHAHCAVLTVPPRQFCSLPSNPETEANMRSTID